MALLLARMATALLDSTTRLSTWFADILTLAWSMTRFLTHVQATRELLPTDLAAADTFLEARPVLYSLFAAHAKFLHEIGAIGTGVLIPMTCVSNFGMTTLVGPFAREVARWWTSATWDWRLQESLAAMTCNVLEDCFFTQWTGSLVAKVGANMTSTFQRSSTALGADML